jgi:tetratricopeptide (TPR) repeat protein
MTTRNLIHMVREAAHQAALIACASALIACGGATAKSGLGDSKPPPPPSIAAGGGGGGGSQPARNISKSARNDYMAALDFYQKQEASGWSSDKCQSAADKFLGVASQHPSLVEARYMAGLSYQNCDMSKQAEQEYQGALGVNKAHAPSLSNLGELYFQAGKVDSAKKYWETALKANSKIVAARNNLAWLLIQEMRKTTNRAAWDKLEEAVRDQLSNSLAVDTDNVKTYVLYGLMYLEGSERNRSRLDLAKLLLDEGAKRDGTYAPLYNARGLLNMKRNNQGQALGDFEKAVELDSDLVEARLNVGNITLGFRKYDVAEQQFTEVLKRQSNNYEAVLGLGVAQRGLGKLDEAEASYKKAIGIDGNRAAAHFNLGVLYKDFRANRATDLKGSQQAYEVARKHFQTYMSKPDASKEGKDEAKDNIADCDKIIKQLGEVIKATAQDQAGGGR